MRPHLLSETIKFHHQINRAMLIEGEPGVGKSTIPEQVAADLGIGFIKFNVPTRALEDYGIPVISEDRRSLDFAVAEGIFPFVGCEKHPDEGILVADELSGGQTPEQKLWASVIQDRHLHERKIKPGWTIVATGNRTKDRAGANRILSMLANRFNRYTMEPNLDDWCQWALANNIDQTVIAFLRFKPDLLSKFDPNQDSNPTPRSWSEGVSPFVNLDIPGEFETYQGAVGEGPAAEFTGFLKLYRSLPNIDAILMQPDKADVPTEPCLLYAVSGAIAQRASPINMDRVMTYAKRLPPEFMVLAVRDSLAHDRTVVQSKAFIDWSCKEGKDVLLG